MKKPTEKQIDAEIKKLETMKPKVRHHDAFGGDNWELIDVEVRCLRGRMSQDDVDDKWDGENDHDHSMHSQTSNVVSWMEGEEGSEAPSKGWKSLIQK